MSKLSTLAMLLFVLTGCTSQRGTRGYPYYEEPTLPVSVHSDWDALSTDLHVSVGSIDQRYEKQEIPNITEEKQWKGNAWRGERLSAQVVVWSEESVKQLRGAFSNFESADGNIIPAEATFIGWYTVAAGFDGFLHWPTTAG